MRTDKDLFIELLNDFRSKFEGDIWSLEGGHTVKIENGQEKIDKLIEEIKEKCEKPIPEITWNPHLYSTAKVHALDIGEKGLDGHIGSDGSDNESRIKKFAKTYIKIAQSIALGPYNGGESVVQLLISDNDNAAVKANLFDPLLRRVGICNHTHTKNNFVTVFVFAGEVFRRGDIDKIDFKLQEFKEKELEFINPP